MIAKFLKKSISVLLGCCFVLSVCGGCNEGGEEMEKPEVDYKWTAEKTLSSEKTLPAGESVSVEVGLDIGNANYVGLDVETDVNLVGKFYFSDPSGEEDGFAEDFFIPSSQQGSFRQIIDFYFANTYEKNLDKIELRNVGESAGKVVVKACYGGTKEWFDNSQVYLESGDIRLGIDLNAGGAINYLEYLNHRVQQVQTENGNVEVGINYASVLGGELMYDSVNLINEMDRGRLVQQSYYGISGEPYESAVYNGTPWPYNPVQGGDFSGTSSQIVDFTIGKDSIYVKTRALDWAKRESVTPSYMENRYTLENNIVKVENSFTDWSGYTHNIYRDQELPAFYGVISLGTLVTYRGSDPFQNEDLSYYPSLGNWVGTNRAYWTDITENWVAWVNDDDFGVGLYTPNTSTILTGKVGTKNYSSQISKADATTYTTMIAQMRLSTYETFSYDYYLTVGQVDKIRQSFNELAETCVNQDIIDWSARK